MNGRKFQRSIPAWESMIAAMVVSLMLSALSTASAGQPVTVKLWNFNIHDKKYQQNMYKLFGERNPDIKIEYRSILATVYDQTLEAARAANETPDIFRVTEGINSFNALRIKGFLKPLNDIAPSAAELKSWMDTFPPQLRRFEEGGSVINGKAYLVDFTGEQVIPTYPLYYNKTMFKDAGIEKPPATQSQMRQSAAKVTQAGQGKSFGAIRGGKWEAIWYYDLMHSLAYAGGARGLPPAQPAFNDGQFHLGGPEFITAFNVWIGMRADGSVFPGDMLLEDEQAKMNFATNRAAMMFGWTWNPGNFLTYNPDCDFDVVFTPRADDGILRAFAAMDPASKSVGGYAVSSSTKNPEAVWKVIKFISSLEYQEGWVKGGFGISYLPEANKEENFSSGPQLYKFVVWGMDPAYRRLAPSFSEGANRARDLMPGIYPTVKDVLDNVYIGKAGFDTLNDLDKRLGAALDAGIAAAQKEGFKVSRADFVFPDWDIMKDYLPKKK